MKKIILSLDGAVIREYPLEKSETKIGRKTVNDVQIDNLAISGEHCVICMIAEDVFVQDLDSTNGTMVNGQPVKRQLLQNNDVLEIGKYKIKFIGEQAARGGDDFEKTMIIRPGAIKPSISPAPVAPTPAPAPAATVLSDVATCERVAAIRVKNGANSGKTLDLVKNITSIGKPGVQVAVLSKRPGGYFITHVEGPRHPSLNGKEIGVNAEALNDHDVIELAGIQMEFFYK